MSSSSPSKLDAMQTSVRSSPRARTREPRTQGVTSMVWDQVRSSAAALSSLAIAVLLVYAVLLTTNEYGLTDDYSILAAARESVGSIARAIVGGGRPGAAFLDVLAFSIVDGSEGLRWLRVVTVLGLALLAGFVLLLLRSRGVPPIAAWCLSLIVVCLPCFQIIGAWSILFHVPYAAMVAGGAALLTERAQSGTARLFPEMRRLVAPIALVLASLTVYQPAAMWYWVVVAVLVVTAHIGSRSVLRATAVHLAVVAAASVASFLILKLGVVYAGTTGARSSLTDDPLDKAAWFIKEPLRRAFDPLSSPEAGGHPRLSIVIGLTVVVVVAVHLVRQAQARTAKAAVLVLLLPLAVLPNLVVAENWASARTLVALSPLVVLVVGTAAAVAVPPWRMTPETGRVSRLANRSITSCMAALALTFAVQAQTVLTQYFVVPHQQESRAALLALEKLMQAGDVEMVYVRPSNWFDTLAPATSYDEFGTPSSSPSFAAVPFLEEAVRRSGSKYAGGFQLLGADETPPADAIVLDMSVVLGQQP